MGTRKKPTTDSDTRPLAIGYCRVSTGRQAEEGLSLDHQEATIRAAAEQRGYRVEIVREEGRSGKSIKGRPELRAALERLDKGEAQALICPRLDRLARSVVDLLDIISRAQKKSWRLVLLDLDLDTATPQGEMVVTIMGAMARFERRLIGERQKDVHAQRKANGVTWGVDAGQQPLIPADIAERITAERAAGTSLRAIAAGLNDDGIPTAKGGANWYASTVSHVLKSPRGQQLQAAG
jgi:DNA invertase Pin-like site-specific DNA recombinase